MDTKKFYYLYFKVRDENKDTILKEGKLTEEEYALFETELAEEVSLIKSERSNIPSHRS